MSTIFLKLSRMPGINLLLSRRAVRFKDLGRAGGGIPQAAPGEDLGNTEIAEIAKPLPKDLCYQNGAAYLTFLHGLPVWMLPPIRGSGTSNRHIGLKSNHNSFTLL